MTLIVSLGGLGLLVLPWLFRSRLTQLSPGEWTRVTSVSLRVGLGLVQFGLFATAAPTVLGGAGGPHQMGRASWRERGGQYGEMLVGASAVEKKKHIDIIKK